jgi:hypothetical protein
MGHSSLRSTSARLYLRSPASISGVPFESRRNLRSASRSVVPTNARRFSQSLARVLEPCPRGISSRTQQRHEQHTYRRGEPHWQNHTGQFRALCEFNAERRC